jgi:hypothetical protein
MTHYLNQTKTQAAASLREFLDKRAPALDHLRESIASDVRNLRGRELVVSLRADIAHELEAKG